MDDGRNGVEEGERTLAGLGSDGFGKVRPGQRARSHDGRVAGKRVDAFPNDRDVGMRLNRARDFSGEPFAINCKRRTCGNAVAVGRAHDQRTEGPHLLVEQADGIVLGVVGAEAVGADHLGKAVGLMRRSGVAATAHFAEPNAKSSLGELPCGFRSGQPAADDMDVVLHRPSD